MLKQLLPFELLIFNLTKKSDSNKKLSLVATGCDFFLSCVEFTLANKPPVQVMLLPHKQSCTC